MTKKVVRYVLLSFCGLLLLVSIAGTTLALTQSSNPNYETALSEFYDYVLGKYRKENTNMRLVVATINSKPIYYADVVFNEYYEKYQAIWYSESTDEELKAHLESIKNQSYQSRINSMARSSALALKAEAIGFTVGDDEVRAAIMKDEQDAAFAMAKSDRIKSEATLIYEDMLNLLDVSPSELNENYLYVLKKNTILQYKYVSSLYLEKEERNKKLGTSIDLNSIIGEAYQEALEEYAFTVLISEAPSIRNKN